MVVDTSVVVAIFFREEGADALNRAIQSAVDPVISAASIVEIGVVLARRAGRGSEGDLWTFLASVHLRTEPVTFEQAKLALDAFARFGKGSGHPARLNFGDCFSYALAKALDRPLLFKGEDFRHTDLEPAL